MHKMTQHRQYLEQIIQNIQLLNQQKAQALCVFDLDSTLFDVSPRLEKVLIDFANFPENQQKFPEQVPFLKDIKTYRSDWGIRNALIRAGLDGHHPEFQHAIKEFWVKTFFSNEYLDYDIPYEGAVEFVQRLNQLGADIVYLTGRDIKRMGPGSLSTLEKWKFPISENALLVLKPEKGMDDAQFKVDWFKALPENKYQKIYFFENEPVNINLLQKEKLDIEIFFFDSTHSGKQQVAEDLPRIMHFLIEDVD